MECPKCKHDITENMLVCPNCKKVLKLECPKCKTINKSNTCKKCGFVIVSKCHNCGKVNQTINGKCSKCGFSTYTSVAINSSNLDEFACLTIEFPNLSDIKSALGSTKLTDKFNANLNALVSNYAGSVGVTREIIEDIYILRFNKDSSFKESAKNAMKAAIEIQNLITNLNFKLNKLKNTLLQCNAAVLKRDIYSPPENYKSGFDIKLIYNNKNTLKLINCLQTITDAAVYEQICDDFELSSLSSTFVKNEMVMFFELNLKKYIKIPTEKDEEEEEAPKLTKLQAIKEDFVESEEESKLYNVDAINFNELKCKFDSLKSTELISEVTNMFKAQRKNLVSIKSKKELLPRTEDLLLELEDANIFKNVFRVTCYSEMKYQPYGFFHQLLSGIYNFAQSPKCFANNRFDMFKEIDSSGFIKDLINLTERTFPHPEDIRYSLFDIFFNIFNQMSKALIYIENFEYIDETSFEVLQMIFEKFDDFDISYLVVTEKDFSLHKKAHFLLANPNYTEITTKPVPIGEIVGKDSKKYEKIIDSYYMDSIAQNTKGSVLYFENAIGFLEEKKLIGLEEDNTYKVVSSQNIFIPMTLDDLIVKRLKNLSKEKNAYKMFCMMLLIGPVVDLFTLKSLQIPNEIEALQLLAQKRFVYAFNNTVYIQNYKLFRDNFLTDMEEDEKQAIASEVLQKVYNSEICHPSEILLFKILNEGKMEFVTWEKLSNLNASMGDFSAYLNCSVKFLKLLDEHVNETSQKTIEEYKMEVYENISNLLYKYSPNEIHNISKIILENLEKTTNDKKVIELCNKMLQGCLIGGNYSYALELANKILSKFASASINPKDSNFDIAFFLISLVKIEILFSIGNLKDCVESGEEILKILTPQNIQILKPAHLSLKQFEEVILDAMFFVLASKIILLENDEKLTAFIEKLSTNTGRLPVSFKLSLTLKDVIRANKVESYPNIENDDNKFSKIVFNLIKAFNENQADFKQFADSVYQAKVSAKVNKLSQIELICDLLIGYSYFKLENYNKASSIYYNVLETSTKNGLKLVTYLDWYFISVLKFEQNDIDIAFGIANNAIIQLEKDNNSGDFLLFLFRMLLAKIFASKNEIKSAQLCLNNAIFIKEKYELNLKIQSVEEIDKIGETS